MTTQAVMPPPIGSSEELMAMACALEQEAGRRYHDLASRMRLRREDELAELFDFFSRIEKKHAADIAERAAEALGGAIAPKSVALEMPENFDEETGSSRLLTPYRALAIAVRNEDRAFAFYSYLAAAATSEQARRLAEELAKEELEHASLLRRERRKAFHRENIGGRPPKPKLPRSLEELWVVSAETEWHAACYHRAIAYRLPLGDTRVAFIGAAEDEARCAREAAERIARDLPTRWLGNSVSMEGALHLLEETFDRYSDIAERAKQEAIMLEAQRLAARAVQRLALVRQSL